MRISLYRAIWTVPVALVLTGCWNKGLLDVPNVNNPDVARTYSSAAGVEGVIASTFQQIWATEIGCMGCIQTQAHNLAMENYSELNNFTMNVRSLLPRAPIVNSRGNSAASDNYNPYLNQSKVTRNAANGIQAMDRLLIANAPVTNALGSPAQDVRARSFAYFTIGWALGGLALAYDSAGIVTPATFNGSFPPLSGYQDVAKAALAMLDSAILVANSPNATVGANGFPLPTTWISGLAITQAQFIQLVRTQKARIRAGIARTPAERAAVDWAAVIADAQAGITADFVVTLSVAAGWSGASTYDVAQVYSLGWGSMDNMILGMADTSGAFANFIGTPISSRNGAFLIRSPDQRLPQGATRAAQLADTPLPLPKGRYFQNRDPGSDTPVAGYGFSFYDHRRYYAIRSNNGNGPWTAINKIEIDMLQAEGYIRQGNFAAAKTLIDASRARNGLPSIGNIASVSTPIQGGANSCVPQVPQPPGFNTVGCGNIMEAMKWEKRMETVMSCMYLCWFTDSRGWGDLAQNTALNWPVPYQEMDARLQPFYSLGGGAPASAPIGTYGY
jgi:hypothetical protein